MLSLVHFQSELVGSALITTPGNTANWQRTRATTGALMIFVSMVVTYYRMNAALRTFAFTRIGKIDIAGVECDQQNRQQGHVGD